MIRRCLLARILGLPAVMAVPVTETALHAAVSA